MEVETYSEENQSDDDPVWLPHARKQVSWLFGAVLRVSRHDKWFFFYPRYEPIRSQVVKTALATLTSREENVIRLRRGLTATQQVYSQNSVAHHLGVSRHKVQEIESNALRKLRRTSMGRGLKMLFEAEAAFREKRSSPQRIIDLVPVIEKIKRLEPSLIAHLKQHNDDLLKINPILFEHLFAEFLAAQGFDDVRLVGRNPKTSADIFAAKFIPAEIPIKLFVEVKRWKDTIGIEVINQVLGAFLSERERFGWNAALIVTVGGFSEFEKWSREELELKGLYLKERDDLLRYLDGYKQHANGLWLPKPRTDL